MNDAGFIAPVEQLWHRFQCAPLVMAARISPWPRQSVMVQNVRWRSARSEPLSPLGLPLSPQSLDEELRQKSKRADAKPGNVYESHRSTSAETLLRSREYAEMDGRLLEGGHQVRPNGRYGGR